MKNRDPIYAKKIPTLMPWPTQLTISLRTRFFLTGLVYPIFCFIFVVFGGRPKFGDFWQDGLLETYVALILSAPAFYTFTPMILFSMIGLSNWCFTPKCYDKKWVRVAIYSGMLLTLQFSVLLAIPTYLASPLMGTIFMIVQAMVFYGFAWFSKRVFRFTILHLLILTTAIAVFSAMLLQLDSAREVLSLSMSLIPFMIGGAPFMALVTFCRVAVAVNFLNRSHGMTVEFPGPTNFRELRKGWFAWLIGWLISWKYAVEIMLDEYAKLPSSPPPGCFISMAAAHGHPRIVGSRQNIRGQLVSIQMARCKMVELALMAAFPRLHAVVRIIYNAVGPVIAGACQQNIWSADLAFVAMKPAEWIAVFLQYWMRIPNSKILALYQVPEPTNENQDLG